MVKRFFPMILFSHLDFKDLRVGPKFGKIADIGPPQVALHN